MAEAQALSTDQSQEYLAEVELVAGLASALGAQGDASTAQLGGQIGSSGFENNYLTHAQRETVEARLAEWVAWRVYYPKAHLSRFGTALLCSNVLIGLIVWGFGAA